jgi:hypothetical protein
MCHPRRRARVELPGNEDVSIGREPCGHDRLVARRDRDAHRREVATDGTLLERECRGSIATHGGCKARLVRRVFEAWPREDLAKPHGKHRRARADRRAHRVYQPVSIPAALGVGDVVDLEQLIAATQRQQHCQSLHRVIVA